MADYSWQLKCVARFAKTNIAAIIAACGTGKTRAGINLAREKRLPVLVIVPKRLTRQWKDEILKIVSPDEDIWIYDQPTETKEGEAYAKKLWKWLTEEKNV